MKKLEQTVVINKPAESVFNYCIDPNNTPKWVNSIIAEETNEWPVGVDTVYRNKDRSGEWSEYKLSIFKPNETFTLRQVDGNYLKYTFTEIDKNTTELIYEWLGEELEQAELKEILNKLKEVIENE